jgi:hypothetical protein
VKPPLSETEQADGQEDRAHQHVEAMEAGGQEEARAIQTSIGHSKPKNSLCAEDLAVLDSLAPR